MFTDRSQCLRGGGFILPETLVQNETSTRVPARMKSPGGSGANHCISYGQIQPSWELDKVLGQLVVDLAPDRTRLS